MTNVLASGVIDVKIDTWYNLDIEVDVSIYILLMCRNYYAIGNS